MIPNISKALSLALAATLLIATGCRVESHKNGNGDGDNVKIATPFGGMQVKTNDSDVAAGVGLPLYPGAVPIKKDDKGHNDGSADINMSFGSFQMRVKAMSFHSDDPSDKIIAFYRPAMAKYGDVITCDHNKPIGQPTRTSQGLTCETKGDEHVHISGIDRDSKVELKAGSEQHQHVVGVERDGDGTKIGLVALDLPGHMSFGDKDSDNDKQ